MAITPRSFRLNPRLVIVAALAAIGVWTTLQAQRASQLVAVSSECSTFAGPTEQWSAQEWSELVTCLSSHGEGDEAYQAATIAVAYHPTDAHLLNLKGFVAARNGDHATAVYDFRTGQRVTGSPDGVFENNIAWTTLFQTGPLNTERAHRVLQQARVLYVRSMERKWSCERAHTGMYVEYAIADLIERDANSQDPRVREAVQRYVELLADYSKRCLDRAPGGDDLVVEELMSWAAMDAEMGRIAGVRNPTRHLVVARAAAARAAELGLSMDRAWCAATVPVSTGINTCTSLF